MDMKKLILTEDQFNKLLEQTVLIILQTLVDGKYYMNLKVFQIIK